MDVAYCLNRKSPDLTFINKFLIVVSVLFASSFNIQSSGFGMTSRFHLVLKNCCIYQLFFPVLRYLPNFFAVLRCSESPNVPLLSVLNENAAKHLHLHLDPSQSPSLHMGSAARKITQ